MLFLFDWFWNVLATHMIRMLDFVHGIFFIMVLI